MKSGARRGLFVTLVLLCLVPLTLRVVALAYAWSRGLYPEPRIIGPLALSPTGAAILSAACVMSICIDWHLMLGLIRRGSRWFATRRGWLKGVALVAPIVSMWISLRDVAVTLRAYANHADPPLGPGHWPIEFAGMGMQALMALLLAVLVSIVVGMAIRNG